MRGLYALQRHQVILNINCFFRSIFKLKLLPNLQDIAIKIKHFPNFLGFCINP